MNGAESLVRTLLRCDVDVCFTNPGTSEMHFVAALDQVPGMRCVLALFEGTATGAADGYFRIADKPASTLLHLGPGLANGLANLHNAKKAGSGIVNIVGEHATSHIALDAPLASDIAGLAAPMSHWVHTSKSSQTVGADGAAAVRAARTAPGQIATLILPGDTAWNEGGTVGTPADPPARAIVDDPIIEKAAQVLKKGHRSLLLLGGNALRADRLEAAGRIAAKTGCALLGEWANACLDRGAGRVTLNRIPYVVEKAVDVLKDFDHIVLMGAKAPIAFFAYPDKPGILSAPGCTILEAADTGADLADALDRLVDATGASGCQPTGIAAPHRPDPATGDLTPDTIATVLGATLPEGVIVVDESVTTGRSFFPATSGLPPHVWMNNLGGSIGYGLPAAIGAAIAAPDNKVLAMIGDGSAMYTVQSLWTMARENLDIVVLIYANRSYRILMGELANVGVQNPGPRAMDMLNINNPDLDWVHMARSMGVEGIRVRDCETMTDALAGAFRERGPKLIEVVC